MEARKSNISIEYKLITVFEIPLSAFLFALNEVRMTNTNFSIPDPSSFRRSNSSTWKYRRYCSSRY